jgi:hypothetical protein
MRDHAIEVVLTNETLSVSLPHRYGNKYNIPE